MKRILYLEAHVKAAEDEANARVKAVEATTNARVEAAEIRATEVNHTLQRVL